MRIRTSRRAPTQLRSRSVFERGVFFCDDSLADGVVDSQSQSQSQSQSVVGRSLVLQDKMLMLYQGDSTVPGSQLAESMVFGDEAYIQDYEAIFAAEIAAAEGTCAITEGRGGAPAGEYTSLRGIRER